MLEVPFIITVVLLLSYAVYAYFYVGLITFLHTVCSLFLLIYNSTLPQSKPFFSSLLAPIDQLTRKQQHKLEINICKICKKLKPPRYYHCRRCQTCIFQMDHHCEWLNCCVGQFNFKVYLHILFNLLILGLYALFQVFTDHQPWLSSSKIPRLIASGFLLWQVIRMLISSYQFISLNQTLIQSYKRVRGQRKSKYEKLKQLFGCQLGISWIIPTYANHKLCNIWQPVFPIKQRIKVEQLTFADEYIYGVEEEDDLDKQHQSGKQQ